MSEPSTTPPVAHRSRKLRFARWLFATLVSSFVVITIWNLAKREWVRSESDRSLASAQAQAAQDDVDWRWDNLNATRKQPPEGKNGAELIPRVKALTHPKMGKWQAKDEWKTRLEVPSNVQFSPQLLAVVRRELGESAEAVKLARTLKFRPFGRRDIALTPNVIDTQLQDTQDTRAVVDLLRWEAILAMEDGDGPRAAEAVFALLNAARSIGDEPFMISQLVRMAGRGHAARAIERLLAQFTNPSELAALQAAIADEAEEPLLLYGLRGDRASGDQLFENLESGVARPDDAVTPAIRSTWGRVNWWFYRPRLRADRAYFLNWMGECIAHARKPIHEQPALFAMVQKPPKDPHLLLSVLLTSGVDVAAHASWRTAAEARCAAVGIACERFRQEHKRWPDTLAELVPAFIPAVPLDPYNRQPLGYAKSTAGVAVYSVGKRPPSQFNQFAPKTPVPEGLPEGIETGFRLWNPDQRRLPPLPEPVEPRGEQP